MIGCAAVSGLAVAIESDATGPPVAVSPGVAVSPRGQLIRVKPRQCASLNDWLKKTAVKEQIPNGTSTLPVYVVLVGKNRETSFHSSTSTLKKLSAISPFQPSAFVITLALSLGLTRGTAAEDSTVPTNSPSIVSINTRADAFIWEQGITDRRGIDLATNLPPGADRTVSATFLESLLTTGLKRIHHDGFRLRHGIITGWLDLRNLDIPVEVQLENCHFKSGVNLSGARFRYDLSFQGSVFDERLNAQALKVDGSLLLNTSELWAEQSNGTLGTLLDAGKLTNYLHTNTVARSWPLALTNLVFNTNRQIMRWGVEDPAHSNRFVAMLSGSTFFLIQANYGHEASQSVTNLTVEPVTNQWTETLFRPVPLDSVRQTLATVLGTNLEFVIRNVLTSSATNGPPTVRWLFGDQDNAASPPLVVWWDGGNQSVKICQPTIFRKEVYLDGAIIAGKLEAWDVEFRGALQCDGMKVGDTIWMDHAQFGGATSFGYVETRHDFWAQHGSFSSSGKVNAYGMTVGGTFNVDWARFDGRADFGEVHVSKDFHGSFVRFGNRAGVINFRGMQAGGSVYLKRTQFAGPVNFILADIKGNFEAEGATFEDARSFKELQEVTQDSFTFNTDFGSMKVGGFALFEQASFARSVSFRHASFGNLHLDQVQWPAVRYANDPATTNLLRVEGVNFHTIRAINTERFTHSRKQLAESQTNLVRWLGSLAPYSFDIYSKLEQYFRREGEPALADEVFIQARKRQGEMATGLAAVGDRLLRWTVGYGRRPGRAFWESCVCVLLWAGLCCAFMRNKAPPAGQPSFGRCLFYSLALFLPIIKLPAEDLLEFKDGKDWMRYLLALERVLGYILVPLWTVSLAGLIK